MVHCTGTGRRHHFPHNMECMHRPASEMEQALIKGVKDEVMVTGCRTHMRALQQGMQAWLLQDCTTRAGEVL